MKTMSEPVGLVQVWTAHVVGHDLLVNPWKLVFPVSVSLFVEITFLCFLVSQLICENRFRHSRQNVQCSPYYFLSSIQGFSSGSRSTKNLKNSSRKGISAKTPPTSLDISGQLSDLIPNVRKNLEFAPKTCIRWLYPILLHIFRDHVDLTERFPTGRFTTKQYKMHFELRVHCIILDLETKLLRRTLLS